MTFDKIKLNQKNHFIKKVKCPPDGLATSDFGSMEKDINDNLFTKNIPDPEILIRTGNTQRLSNFLLWQIAYTEIFFEKRLWPDFRSVDLDRIIKKFSTIKRNFGKI